MEMFCGSAFFPAKFATSFLPVIIFILGKSKYALLNSGKPVILKSVFSDVLFPVRIEMLSPLSWFIFPVTLPSIVHTLFSLLKKGRVVNSGEKNKISFAEKEEGLTYAFTYKFPMESFSELREEYVNPTEVFISEFNVLSFKSIAEREVSFIRKSVEKLFTARPFA